MKVVYIAGPYTDKDPAVKALNIAKAGIYAMQYSMLDFAVICPHKNNAHFDLHNEKDTHWIKACKELLSRSDIVVMIPNWTTSSGAVEEYKLAVELGKQIIFE